MRKFLALLAVTALLLMSVSALAAGVDIETHDFGDFTLSYPSDSVLQEMEKAEGSQYFILYSVATSTETFSNNLNANWSSNYEDLTALDPQMVMDATISGIQAEIGKMGITLESLNGDNAELIEVDGRPAMILEYSYVASYNNLTLDVKNYTMIISDPALGTYTFAITAANDGGMDELKTVLNSIHFNG